MSASQKVQSLHRLCFVAAILVCGIFVSSCQVSEKGGIPNQIDFTQKLNILKENFEMHLNPESIVKFKKYFVNKN